MLDLPPLPATWDGLHPLIIHIPIGLLLIAPLFILIGAIRRANGRPFLITAFLLMLVGTIAALVAIRSGEAAGQLVERTPEINVVLQHHEELAERTRLVFSILTFAFAAILVAPAWFRKTKPWVFATVLPLVFLVFYGLGAIVLINTGHNGGRLVHEFGVHAIVGTPPE